MFKSHRILFEKNIPAFENLANLDELPEVGFHVIALPMKIKGRQWGTPSCGRIYPGFVMDCGKPEWFGIFAV